MRDAAHLPQLGDDASTLGVHGIGDLPPRGNLFARVQAGRVEITLRFAADLGCLGDEESGDGRSRRAIFSQLLSVDQTAAVLKISAQTTVRGWMMARA